MGVIYANKQAVADYFANPALNQSKLKNLEEDPSLFLEEQEQKTSIAFQRGKGVDTLLTSPKGTYEEEYYVSKLEKVPSEAMMKITERIVNSLKEEYYNHFLIQQASPIPVIDAVVVTGEQEVRVTEDSIFDLNKENISFVDFCGELESHPEKILSACLAEEWNNRYGEEAKLKAVHKEASEYFKDIVASEGKVVISSAENSLMQSIAKSLRTHHRTAFLFDTDFYEKSPIYDIYYQMPIYFEFRGVKCKALLDIVLVEINPITKEVVKISPYDLKTMAGNTVNFGSNVRSFRYDRQGAWYTEALANIFGLDLSNPQEASKIEPFQFVVESTTRIGKPIVFVCSRELMEIGRTGLSYPVLGKKYLGIYDLIELYLYHEKHGFAEEKILQDYAGMPLVLGWDKIEEYGASL